MEKITKKEMYLAIIETMETGECKYPPERVQEFCRKEIEQLDNKAQKAKEKAEKKKLEADVLMDKTFEVLDSEEFQSISDIVNKISDFPEVTNAKVTYRLNQLVKAGKAEKQEITVASGEKSRKVQGYRKSN